MTSHRSLLGEVTTAVSNRPDAWPVIDEQVGFANDYLTVTVDTIADPSHAHHSRVVVRPRGAVGVVALDEDGRILLVQQFRHAVGRRMVEIPAGILDVPGESAQSAAARELAEEADVLADSWAPLLTLHTTPGFCSEQLTLFLARDLSRVPVGQRTDREAEEADMQHWWIDLDRAVDAVLAGEITDAKTVAGILAASRLR